MSTAIQIGLLVLLLYIILRFARKDKVQDTQKGKAQHASEGTIFRNRIGDGMRELAAKKKKYAIMTPVLIAETPDETLVEAVLCNLWAKMRPDLSDAFDVMQALSLRRQYFFTLYAITGGIRQAGIQKLKESSDARLLPQCLEALEAVSITGCAEVLREAMQAEDGESYTAPYLEHFTAEDGYAKLVDFIRVNAADFCDAQH